MELEGREKAENKIILLYFINAMRIPVSNTQLTRIMLENRFMNYFLLQQALHEAVDDGLIRLDARDGIDYCTNSPEGLKMLEMFENLLPAGIRKSLDEIARAVRPDFRNEASVVSDYSLEDENEYEVKCRIVENDKPLIDIRLSVGSREDARNICRNWQSFAKEIYPQVIGVLLRKET